MRGNLYIISAPSGSGKTTLLQHLLRNLKDLKFSISHTTRSPRQGERDGVDLARVVKDQWLDAAKLRPVVVAEFDDSALMYAFGEDGRGFFPAPTVFEEEFRRRYNVRVVGRSKAVRQQFYAISVDQRLHHPAVMAIVHAAREDLFR